jgi:transposase
MIEEPSLYFHIHDLGIDDVVRKYYDKDSLERAFRQMKGVFDLRPVKVRLKSHIEGHVKVCCLAYSILSYLSYIM